MTTTEDTLRLLADRLDAHQSRYNLLDAYYRGQQDLAYLSPEAREALGDRLGRMASNIPRLAVVSLAERLRVTGFTGVDVWPEWLANDLDQMAPIAHREALTLGRSYALVWADSTGSPAVSIESARQVSVLRDPGTRKIIAGLKRWEDDEATYAVMYGPDKIIKYRADTKGATVAGFKITDTIPNPLGVPPVVEFRNGDRLLDHGCSELDDLIPLVDALDKLLADMLVGSEFYARPRRWATGIELEEAEVLDPETGEPTGETEAVNPFPEDDRMMTAEDSAAKFGQLPAADLGAYNAAIATIVSQISAVSALPAHYLGITTANPSSADALRAAEASLTARAEARQQSFGRSWEQVARLIAAVRDGSDPAMLAPRVQWADAATRSVAQEADAVTKLFAAGLLPASYALKRLGYSDTEVDEIRAARRTDTLDTAGADVKALLP